MRQKKSPHSFGKSVNYGGIFVYLITTVGSDWQQILMIHHRSKAANFKMTIFVQMLINIIDTCSYYCYGFIQEIRHNDKNNSYSLKTPSSSNKKNVLQNITAEMASWPGVTL